MPFTLLCSALLGGTTAAADSSAQQADWTSFLPMILIYVAFFVLIYFIAIRPSRKREKEAQQMQNAITKGDWVLLNDGMYGKVVDTVNDCLMVELGTARSVVVPVRRDQVIGKQEPNLTAKKIEEVEAAPTDDLVGDDIKPDELDAYDKYLLEKGAKKGKKEKKAKKDANVDFPEKQ